MTKMLRHELEDSSFKSSLVSPTQESSPIQKRYVDESDTPEITSPSSFELLEYSKH